MYQRCPVCDGYGYRINQIKTEKEKCYTCKGFGIISEETGLPPTQPRPPQNTIEEFRQSFHK